MKSRDAGRGTRDNGVARFASRVTIFSVENIA